MEWMLLPLKRYADFSGRSRRKEYWMFTLGIIVAFLALVAVGVILSAINETLSGTVLIIGYVVILLGTLIPSLAVQVRRFHDQDKPGWFLLIGLIVPFFTLIFMCLEGTKGPNRYGPDPKGDVGRTFD